MQSSFKKPNYKARPLGSSVVLSSASLALALMAASPIAFAQAPAAQDEGYCSPEVARQMVEAIQQAQKDHDDTFGDLLKGIKKVAEDSMADLSACVDTSWPSMKMSYPSMDQIIRGVAQTAVRKACGVARDAIAEKDAYFRNSFYLNTRIPGVPSYGITTSGSGSGGIQWGSASSGGSYGSSTGGATTPPSSPPPTSAPPAGFPGSGLFTPAPAPPKSKPPITP